MYGEAQCAVEEVERLNGFGGAYLVRFGLIRGGMRRSRNADFISRTAEGAQRVGDQLGIVVAVRDAGGGGGPRTMRRRSA